MGNDQSRAFMAVILSGMILFGWSYFFGPDQADIPQEVAEKVKAQSKVAPSTNAVVANSPVLDSAPVSRVIEKKFYTLENGDNQILIDNSLNIKDFKSYLSEQPFSDVMGAESSIAIAVQDNNNFSNLIFDFEQIGPSEIKGVDSLNNVMISLLLDPMGRLNYSLKTNDPRKFQIIINSTDKINGEEPSGGILAGASPASNINHIRRYTILSNELLEFNVSDEDSGENSTKWFGVDAFYHMFGIIFNDKQSVSYQSKENGTLVVSTNSKQAAVEGKMIFAKKLYNELKELGDNLHLSVNFGFFSIIALPMFKALKMVYSVIPNWGFAIILLTLLIRFVTFPLYYKQMKSMNKMKTLQPHIQKIKEKYKDDTKRQQVETMELFKRSGVNPVGGCLPLILQMPIFFAFYKVLTVTSELDQAGFLGWITNLTDKDPFYVLPVLVAAVMWLNQKFMPTTTSDPTQQKVMKFLPLIFGFFFINMPAGLNIYILVSTAFGILQQIYVNKRVET